MKRTMLGNPLIRPWTEVATLTEHFHIREYRFASYYICCGMKPLARDMAAECGGTSKDDPGIDVYAAE